ncbi:MAG: NAD(P)H-dependent oxidoreductase [Dermatophilaceae bacterium]
MSVLVLVGSLRAGSLNARLAQAAIAHLPEGVDAQVWAGLADLPHYSEDLDGATPPEQAGRLRTAVAQAQAVLIVTPEYNGSLPSAVKNAVDWLSRPRGAAALAGKRAAVLAASISPRAAQWAREDAVKVLRVAGADVVPETLGMASTSENDFDGTRLADAQADAALAALVQGLLAPDAEVAA